MHPHMTSDQVKIARITEKRPGIVEAFMQPTRLDNQVRYGTTRANLRFAPAGKNLVGGTQWSISLQRPGLAQPLIVAKQEQKALEAGLAQNARINVAQAKGMSITGKMAAAKTDVTEEVVEEAEAEAGFGQGGFFGYGNYYGAYGTSW